MNARLHLRSPTLWLAALALAWALELWVVQEQVLVATFKTPEMLRTRQLFRLGLDLALAAVLVFTLPRRWLHGLFVLQFVVFVLGGVYHDYYGRLPRLTAVAQTGEGLALLPRIPGMVRPGRALLLLALLGLKSGLLYHATRTRKTVSPALARGVRYGGTAVYATLFAIATLTFDPMTNMKRWGTANRFGMTYGFTIPMLVEAYYAGSSSLLERALRSAENSTDRLTPVEAELQVLDRVVFLQIESLDWGVMDFEAWGREITPNLNALKRRSLYYKAEAAHFTGSADADFVATMARWPSRDLVTYKIEGYPWNDALPRWLGSRGVETTAIHGVSGHFFNRREAFTRMGFERLLFREELAERGVPARHERYDWIQDAELLEVAAEELSRARGPVFHLVITVTSHSPFAELPADERAKCAGYAGIYERYLCSMEYVDRAVGRYVERLPEGTTLVAYGDHNSSVEHDGYDSGRRGDRDFVPVFIHNRPGDLAERQKTGRMATDGSLSFVDVMRYVHTHIRRRFEPNREPPAEAAAR